MDKFMKLAIEEAKIGLSEGVVVGESENYHGTKDFLKSKGVEVVDLDLKECKDIMKEFINKNPDLWYEDIGEL